MDTQADIQIQKQMSSEAIEVKECNIFYFRDLENLIQWIPPPMLASEAKI